MDKLQWFKFTPTDWIMGKIQRCPEVTQARFMRLCCLYWNKECLLTFEDAEIEIDKEHLDILSAKKIIKRDEDGLLNIEFLNEQLCEIEETSGKRRNAVNLRWERYREKHSKVLQNNTSVSKNNTSVLQNDTEKIREDKRRKEKIENIPEWTEFLAYGLEKEPSVDHSALKNKYDAWVANDWNDGNNTPIKNWKSKLLHTMPHIKKIKSSENGKLTEQIRAKDPRA